MNKFLFPIIAISAGIVVGNLYYAQPLVGQIAAEIGVSPRAAGAIVSVFQVGYGAGLLLLAPLADLVENRALILTLLSATVVSLVAFALSSSVVPFFVAAFLVGLTTTAVQVLVPLAAHFAPDHQRGRIVGNVMAGLLTGIMLARPTSLFVSAAFGWRAVFFGAAAVIAALVLLLRALLPQRKPAMSSSYAGLLASMGRMVLTHGSLRRTSLYQACVFAAFNIFWTGAPLLLAQQFHLSEARIGLFALAGAGGALSAPIAGRLADRGLGPIASPIAMAVVVCGFLATHWARAASSVVVLAVLAIVIDAGVQASQNIARRNVLSTSAEARSRGNSIFMTTLFIGGAVGSTIATLAWRAGGWTAVANAGALAGVVALILFAVEQRAASTKPPSS